MQFDPRDSREVEAQFKKFVRALKDVDEALAKRLFDILVETKGHAMNNTHAIVLVASEIGRGINNQARSPLVRNSNGMSAELANALAQAERFGREIAPYALARKGLHQRLFRRPRLGGSSKKALMKCVAIGVSQQRRVEADRLAAKQRLQKPSGSVARRPG